MSKYMFFDFRCTSCGIKFEGFVKPDVLETPCDCGGTATRTISAPRIDPRMGIDPDFKTMADKWSKLRQQRAKSDKAHYERHGTDRTPGADTSG